jgi:phosphoenolpyruvate carboxykinase (ATP)
MAVTQVARETKRSTSESILPKSVACARLLDNPTWEELRRMARPSEWTTQWGNAAYVTRVRSRSGAFTKSFVDEPANTSDRELIAKVQQHLEDKALIQVDRSMGKGPSAYHCRIYISEHAARVALFWSSALFPPPSDYAKKTPDLVTVYVEEWPERRVLVDAENGVTYVLGVDYYGECKKSFLRMGMYKAKREHGGLGLHAGSKILRVKEKGGALVERGAIFFGLSGTGKTSLTCHPHELEGEEKVEILQDDVVFMMPDGACLGTEEGFYIKTDGLRPEDQPTLYYGIQEPRALMENVWVGPDREVDFDAHGISKNGRAIVWRSDIDLAGERIDLDKVHMVFFITRNQTIVPPVARLTPEQGAAAFMLGESIKTSAADPKAAGEPVREVGTNPFIVGSKDEEGNRFLEILERNKGEIQCFLLNTGKIGGPDGEKISLMTSQAIIREIARGTVEWAPDADWGYEVATKVPGIDLEKLDPKKHYDEATYGGLVEGLKGERRDWLKKFPALRQEIVDAFPLA